MLSKTGTQQVMENIIATLASCLLAVSFATAQTQGKNFSIVPATNTTPPPGLNVTAFVTSSNFTDNATVFSNATENTTPFTSMTWDNETLNDTTSHAQTPQPTAIMTPVATSPSLTPTPGTDTPTTPANESTTGYTPTANSTLATTANSTHVVTPTLNSEDRSTQGLGLNVSERNMTIAFSVLLGVFSVALVVLMVHRCKHKIQYLHQPLNNTGDTGVYEADGDTLVISGGLYDDHPIYDNVPTAPEDQTQFRLEFL